jgi:hypothetical protein
VYIIGTNVQKKDSWDATSAVAAADDDDDATGDDDGDVNDDDESDNRHRNEFKSSWRREPDIWTE